MTMALTLVTAPAQEPLALASAKSYLGIDESDTTNDTLVGDINSAARRFCEEFTKLSFVTQTWDLWLDGIPNPGGRASKDPWWDGVRSEPISFATGGYPAIEIPKAPLQSVTFLKYYDTSDTQQTFDLAATVTDPDSKPGRLILKTGSTWPVDLRSLRSINIRFVAGFGDDGTSLPESIMQAIRIMVSHYYENREALVEGRLGKTPLSVETLLEPFIVRRI